MSHIVVIKAEVRDAGAVRAACQRLRLPEPVEGTHANLTRARHFLHRAGQHVRLGFSRWAVAGSRTRCPPSRDRDCFIV